MIKSKEKRLCAKTSKHTSMQSTAVAEKSARFNAKTEIWQWSAVVPSGDTAWESPDSMTSVFLEDAGYHGPRRGKGGTGNG